MAMYLVERELGVRCAEASCVPTPELEFIADPKSLD